MTRGYQAWQSLLSAAFLLPRAGPIVFFLDDDELARLSPRPEGTARESAAEDLAEAVCSEVRIVDGRAMFAPVVARYEQWRRGSQLDPPPVLPVLALTVLAATRMRSDTEARSTNYYLRLAQALAPRADSSLVDSLRSDLGVGGAFLDVVEMWRGLHAWIEAQHGTMGASTIRDHAHLRRIGYPLSQALVRQSDRITLTRFFQALDFAPGQAPDARVIVGALDIWTAAAPNRLSEAFMHALGDSELRPLLATVVEAHAKAWDGRVLTSDGKQRIAMLLSIDLDRWLARWLFPVPPNGPATLTLHIPSEDREMQLRVAASHDYYSVEGGPAVRPEQLLAGLRLRGSEFTAEFPASPVVFLRLDPQTGAWSSTSGMLPFEEHLVAISAPLVTEFQHVLSQAAAGGWRPIRQRGAALLAGYALFQNVRFADGEALALALSGLPGLRRIGVTPVIVPRPRLVRGLPLATSISAAHYLAGGEPDLLLPSGADPRPVTVTLDGRREQLLANGFPLELRRFISAIGRHIVDADGQELAFTTLEEGPDPAQPAGTGTLGWTSRGEISGQPSELVITGARIRSSAELPQLLARRGRDESWLLHDDGHAEPLSEPAPPRFLSSVDTEIHLPRFEIRPPGSARWLAQRRGARWRVTEIGSSGPEEYDLAIDVLDAWRRACADPSGAQLWVMQLNMAGGAS